MRRARVAIAALIGVLALSACEATYEAEPIDGSDEECFSIDRESGGDGEAELGTFCNEERNDLGVGDDD
jgi:uncharacterized membrane protein